MLELHGVRPIVDCSTMCGCSMLEAHEVHPIVDCSTMCGCSMLEVHGVHPIVDCSTMCVGVHQLMPLRTLLCCTIVKYQIKKVSACVYAKTKLDSEALRTSLTKRRL